MSPTSSQCATFIVAHKQRRLLPPARPRNGQRKIHVTNGPQSLKAHVAIEGVIRDVEATQVVTCSVSTMQVETGILIESGRDDRYRRSANLNRESVLGLDT